MHRWPALLLALVAMGWLCACAGQRSNDTGEPARAAVAGGAAAAAQPQPAPGPDAAVEDFTLVDGGKLVRTYEGCDPESEEPPCTNIDLSWPLVHGTGPVAAAVRDFISLQMRSAALGEEPAASLETLADEFLTEYAEFRGEFPDNDFPWAVERTMRVAWGGERLLTLVFEEYSYLGGAHPNTALSYWVLDRATGRRVMLSDLLVDGYAGRLTAIAEAAFRAHHGIAPDASLDAAGFWFDEDRFALNDNWGVDADGLRFYFNPYEVAAYALGPTEIVLTRASLAELIRTDGPWH